MKESEHTHTTTLDTVEYEQLLADAERWRYFIETASGEAAFELTGVTDASNEQINKAIDQAIDSNPKDNL